MKNSFVLGALIAAAPVAFLLPGCSGGSSGNPFGTATATPATATPVPTVSQVSNLTLGNGQRAILTTLSRAGVVTGTLQIVPTTANTRTAAALPFQFAFGSYAITGTISPSGAFEISGNLGTFGQFSMTGQLQSATQDGSYTLKVNGETDTGILPKSGAPTGTSTPVPTTPPVGGAYNLTGNLTFSDVSAGSEVVSTPITSFNDFAQGGTLTTGTSGGSTFQNLGFGAGTGRLTGNGTSRLLQISLSSVVDFNTIKPFSVGQVVTLNPSLSAIQFSQNTVQGTSISIKVWRAVSGTATIKAISSNSASIELKNVRIDPAPIFGGTGSFTLNGTLNATGLTAKTQ